MFVLIRKRASYFSVWILPLNKCMPFIGREILEASNFFASPPRSPQRYITTLLTIESK